MSEQRGSEQQRGGLAAPLSSAIRSQSRLTFLALLSVARPQAVIRSLSLTPLPGSRRRA